MRFIKKKKLKKIHIINENVGRIPDSALKHWAVCGAYFESWPSGGDDFVIVNNAKIVDICKKCAKKL
jgi:hypothetical protein